MGGRRGETRETRRERRAPGTTAQRVEPHGCEARRARERLDGGQARAAQVWAAQCWSVVQQWNDDERRAISEGEVVEGEGGLEGWAELARRWHQRWGSRTRQSSQRAAEVARSGAQQSSGEERLTSQWSPNAPSTVDPQQGPHPSPRTPLVTHTQPPQHRLSPLLRPRLHLHIPASRRREPLPPCSVQALARAPSPSLSAHAAVTRRAW